MRNSSILVMERLCPFQVFWKLPVSIAAGGIARILLIVVLVVVVRN